MHIIWTLIVGLIVGAIAKLLMPGRDPGGIFITMLLGVAGAFIAGFIGRAVGLYHAGDVGPGLIASIHTDRPLVTRSPERGPLITAACRSDPSPSGSLATLTS